MPTLRLLRSFSHPYAAKLPFPLAFTPTLPRDGGGYPAVTCLDPIAHAIEHYQWLVWLPQ